MTTTEGFVVEEVRYKMRADGPCLAADPCGSLGGVWCGAQRRVGGLLGRNMEPLFYLMRQTPLAIVCLPGSQPKLITSTVTFHGGNIDGLFFDRRHTHWDSSPPAACPPSPCINIDRLTRSHQRPYRCFLPAATLDLLDQRPISAPSQKSRASQLPNMGCALPIEESGPRPVPPLLSFPPRGQIRDKQTWGKKSVFLVFPASCSPPTCVGC